MPSQSVNDTAEFASCDFTSDLGQLADVRQFLKDFCRSFESTLVCEEDVAQLELAITETVSNVIRHAYNGVPGQLVRCEAAVDGDQFSFLILHDGAPFEESHEDVPDVFEPQEGGMGLFLISQCVDEIFYSTVDGRQCIHLHKALKNGESYGDDI